jgi:predicted nucleotidyltransferase
MFGLKNSDIEVIRHVLAKYGEIDEAILFGSRAKGSHRPGSDVDIAIKGSGGNETASLISTYLNQETTLPYFFDIIDYKSVDNDSLIDHINRVGQPIYIKN